MFSAALLDEAARLLEGFRTAQQRLVTAESCTGGLITALLTEIPGSSDVVERGFVTYSNAAKQETLGVSADALAAHGAVSEAVARAMAEGALVQSHADMAVSVTGIAGPSGSGEKKPIGLVHIAVARRAGATLHRECRFGDIGRARIRLNSLKVALSLLRLALAE
ncbi:MAG: CinA family protein [Hyphomicrobiaceae bacterium]|nr:CinA family protein [Hyphomicrobiaceae bacterium]